MVLAALVVVLAAIAGYLVWHAQDAAASKSTLEADQLDDCECLHARARPGHLRQSASWRRRRSSRREYARPVFSRTLRTMAAVTQDQMSQFLQSHPDKAAA